MLRLELRVICNLVAKQIAVTLPDLDIERQFHRSINIYDVSEEDRIEHERLVKISDDSYYQTLVHRDSLYARFKSMYKRKYLGDWTVSKTHKKLDKAYSDAFGNHIANRHKLELKYLPHNHEFYTMIDQLTFTKTELRQIQNLLTEELAETEACNYSVLTRVYVTKTPASHYHAWFNHLHVRLYLTDQMFHDDNPNYEPLDYKTTPA